MKNNMKNYATGIQHIGIPTKDMEATKAFFAKLGFEPAFETVNEGAKVGAIDHVAIDVKDIEETYKEVCAMDLNTTNDEIHFLPFWDNGVKFFTIKGPNEEKVEFSQFL